jgi:hypothetical protein
MALGRLCVSTLMLTPQASSRATTPELSLKTESAQSTPSAMSSCVAAATVRFSRLSMVTVPSLARVAPGMRDQSMERSEAGPR